MKMCIKANVATTNKPPDRYSYVSMALSNGVSAKYSCTWRIQYPLKHHRRGGGIIRLRHRQ